MNIIVGSKALEIHNMARKAAVDVDYWVSSEDDIKHLTAIPWRTDIVVMPLDILEVVPCKGGYATPDAIYTIKCSHAVYDIHWEKTKLDILWLRSNGCKILPELYSKLVTYWKKVHGDKEFLSLKQDKAEFFNDHVAYVYDHDYLHELVSYPDTPKYREVLKDNEEVLIDKDKFFILPFECQLRMFREEITVIACERFLINPATRGKVSWYKAYSMALRKTVTTLTKGWASEFLVINLDKLVTPDYSYFEYLINSIEEIQYMSERADLKVFEEVKALVEGEDGLEYMVFEMAEGDFNPSFGIPYSEVEYPYKKNNPKYESQIKMYEDSQKAQEEKRLKKLEESGIEYTHLESEGGGEGGAEDCYGVFKLNGVIYRAEYYYRSYEGHDTYNILNTLKVVTPKQKTITVYE